MQQIFAFYTRQRPAVHCLPDFFQRQILLPGLHYSLSRFRPDNRAVRPFKYRLGNHHRLRRSAIRCICRYFRQKIPASLPPHCHMAEMCLLAFVPLGNNSIIFWAFFINRVLSGLAEAMASGADEAIAYDALAAEGNTDDWPKVLSLQMRLRSIGTIVTHDHRGIDLRPQCRQSNCWYGSAVTLIVTQQMTMRFPIYLTLVIAVFATITAFKMEEKKKDKTEETGFNTLPH